MRSDCEPSIIEALRIHAETLGASGMPASRQLLMEAADEIERLRATIARMTASHRQEECDGK